MGNCIRCGNKTLKADFLYCKNCYNEIIDFCQVCEKGIFEPGDLCEILLEEEDGLTVCSDCYKNILKLNDFVKKNNDDHVDVFKLKQNDYVIHKIYGFGKVIKLDNVFITFEFCDESRDFYKKELNNLGHIIYKVDSIAFEKKFLNNDIEDISNKKKKITKEKYAYSYLSDDGHPARSRGEQLIDNYLFNHDIKHAYEKVIVSEVSGNELTCDWYLPDYDVYIEFWGVENSKRYEDSKDYKLKIYKECGLELFELTPDDVNLRLDYCFQKFKFKYKKIK